MTGAEPSHPYVGLRAFEADEWDRFFARSTWTKIVIANVVASRLTLLYGESGVGKTSLLQAGVEHELSEPAANGGGGRGRSRLVPVVFRTWQGGPVAPLIAEDLGARRAAAGAARDPARGVALGCRGALLPRGADPRPVRGVPALPR